MLFMSKEKPKQLKERSFSKDKFKNKGLIYNIKSNAKINCSFLETPRSFSRKVS